MFSAEGGGAPETVTIVTVTGPYHLQCTRKTIFRSVSTLTIQRHPTFCVIQTSHASTSSSPQQRKESSSASPLVLGRAYNQVSAPEAPPSHQPLVLEQSQPDPAPTPDVSMDPTHLATAPIQVKEESRRGYDSEDACMDTHPQEEGAEPCERHGEELDISFDSQFPDLISDLITEEANPIAAQPVSVSAAPNPAVFPAGVRYMVPPQPTPSSSFLPFPHPLPSSSSRLASITDFSPEWSYPEVTNQLWLRLFIC